MHVPLDRATNRLRYLILAIQAKGNRQLNSALEQADAGVTSTQAEVLEVLAEQGALSQSDLATQLVCTKGNISRLLDRMEAKKLLSRDIDPESRRRTLIRISDEGREAYVRATRPIAGLLATIGGLYSETELAQLDGLLTRLIGALDVQLADHVQAEPTAPERP
jgi:DNA-binding MarR family transcriptional regulator